MGVGVTWHRVLVVVLEPPEKSIDRGEDVVAVPESFRSHRHILNSVSGEFGGDFGKRRASGQPRGSSRIPPPC